LGSATIRVFLGRFRLQSLDVFKAAFEILLQGLGIFQPPVGNSDVLSHLGAIPLKRRALILLQKFLPLPLREPDRLGSTMDAKG
jgi:hypothetical protein